MPGRPLLLSASATPYADGGAALDLDAIAPLCAELARLGADGVFCCGTTGEGVLLSLDERRAAATRFREACEGTLIVHCGAQSTADTAALAEHARDLGADGVGVIAPPYYPLDVAEQTAHFTAAARACDPLPFYMYAFTARSGYPLAHETVARVREACPNLAGIKVSESPWERAEPYLGLGLPVFIGNEPLLLRGMEAGAVGTVSGMSAAFPDVVRAALDDPSPAAAERLAALRGVLQAAPFVPSVKHALRRRGVAIAPDVRAPLRGLTEAERTTLDLALDGLGL